MALQQHNTTSDKVTERLKELTEEIIGNATLFLVGLEIKPGNHIVVFIDGDEGVSIDAVSKVSKALYKRIEETKVFQNSAFSLEVSSPGIGAPLRQYRQYPKNIGRLVRIVLKDNREIEGVLKAVNEQEIHLEKVVTAKQPKTEEEEMVVPFEQIESTVVVLPF